MLRTPKKKYIYLAVIIFLLILIIYQYILINSIKEETSSQIESWKQEYSNLNQKYQELNSTFKILEEDYNQLTISHEEIKDEVESTIDDLINYQNELEDSMKWFKENSYLKDTQADKKVKRYINANCFEIESDKCYIKTGCFYLVNSEFLDYEYLYDSEIINEGDKLLSLNEFMENNGGDCEDYSLFYKAEFNYVLDKCKDMEPGNIIIEGWVEDPEEYQKYWLDFDKDWYFKDRNIKKVNLKSEYIYPNIICGSMYDLNMQDIGGHCMIAFTKNKIESKEDIFLELDGAPIVEPQTGEYMGLINNYNIGIYLISEYSDYHDLYISKYGPSYIDEIITDDDLFLFFYEEEDWFSYSYFDKSLDEDKVRLQQLLK